MPRGSGLTALSSPPGLQTLDAARPRRQRRFSQEPLRVAGSERRSLNLKLRAHGGRGRHPAGIRRGHGEPRTLPVRVAELVPQCLQSGATVTTGGT